ncbi:Hypothetical protein PHPALM_17416 [Phytophthora palmivora]|uniref:Uncharacterized protein n=1 Tax=Phytophthora palmivora TaxID=4796 RepID=A0A2P4XMA3_9STRA|nr:Hypothetical protein PHPALM_17416 [Phytophthora palmivora]
MLTPVQRESLIEIISSTLDEGGQIPWRNMIQSSTFANLTYDTLRREGKTVLRQLSKPKTTRNKPSRQCSEHEPGFSQDHERVVELEALVAHKDEIISDENKHIKALKLQVQELTAAIGEKNEHLVHEEKLLKQVEALQQCVSELSAIIASKDKLLAETNARYDALKEGIRQLMFEE